MAGIGMWASDLGWACIESGHSLFSLLVYILTSQLGFSVDECPCCGMGEVSCPGSGDCLCCCGSEYWGGGRCCPIGGVTDCVTGSSGGGFLCADCVTSGGGGWVLHANCVTGGGIGDHVLEPPVCQAVTSYCSCWTSPNVFSFLSVMVWYCENGKIHGFVLDFVKYGYISHFTLKFPIETLQDVGASHRPTSHL